MCRYIGALAFVLLAAPAGAQQDEMYRPRPQDAYPPAVYCGWNRTGLPPTQQRICIDRDRRQAEAAVRTQANASPALLKFEETMRPYNRYLAVAYYALGCRARSEGYFKLFQSAQIMVSDRLRNELRLSNEELNAASADYMRTLRQVRDEISPDLSSQPIDTDPNWPSRPRCTDLVGHPILEETDQAERKLTNNYH